MPMDMMILIELPVKVTTHSSLPILSFIHKANGGVQGLRVNLEMTILVFMLALSL